MSKKAKKYFSPYSKPHAPSKPPKKVWQYKEVYRASFSRYDGMDISNIDANYIHLDNDNLLDGDEIVFSKRTEIDNPDYEKQYAMYRKKYAAYQAELKEWNIQYEKWKTESDAQNRKARKEQYLELKKEFENDRNN